MKWVTRENAGVDRIACPWLIKRFIDTEAEFIYVNKDEVLDVAEREGAHSYDAPAAEYTHRDGKCSFEALVEDFDLAGDPALVRLAEIVHAADVSEDKNAAPEGAGLSAIAGGFRILHGTEDHRKIELETPRCMTRSMRGVSSRRHDRERPPAGRRGRRPPRHPRHPPMHVTSSGEC